MDSVIHLLNNWGQYFQMVLFAFQHFTKWKLEILSNFFFLFVGVEELKGHDENPPTILCKTREGNLNHSLRRSPHVRESKTILDSGFHAVDSGIPDTTGFLLWILWQWNSDSRIQSLLGFRIPCSFRIEKPRIPKSGFPYIARKA